MPLKVSSNSGSFDYSDLADGYVWAADNGAKVINTSLSGQTGSQALMEAVSYASDSGAVLVCSTGNMGSDSPRIPAVLTETISVGATDDDDVWWSDSSYGPHIDLVAPGVANTGTAPVTRLPWCPVSPGRWKRSIRLSAARR